MFINLLILVGFLIPSYAYFWLHSFDQNLRVRVYIEGAPKNVGPEMTFDAVPGKFRLGATAWTCVLGTVAWYNSGNCTFHPTTWWSKEALLAVATIAVTGKVIFGPGGSSFKTFLLTRSGPVRRPIAYRISDALAVKPINLIHKLWTKAVLFSAFWVLVWILRKFGFEDRTTTTVLPLYIVLAWALTYVGRLAIVLQNISFTQALIDSHITGKAPVIWDILNRKKFEERVLSRTHWTTNQKVIFLLIMAAAFVTTFALLEHALQTCGGASNGGLPSAATILAGLALIPIVEVLIGLAVDVFAALISHGHG